MTEPKDANVCLMCGRPKPSTKLLCANCRQPIGKRDRWTHDEWSRAVHVNCDQPTGFRPVTTEVSK